jgi:signal transduction histidine kinase
MNVHRHAQASCCQDRLAIVDGSLEVEISDDGNGLPETYRPGIGLRSMQERAAELGGSCCIEPLTPHGTSVLARLPISAT